MLFKRFSQFQFRSSNKNTKTAAFKFLDCASYCIERTAILFIDIDIILHHSKELTVERTQIGEHNVWVRVCWLAGQCEGKFSIQNQPRRRAKCFTGISKKTFVDGS